MGVVGDGSYLAVGDDVDNAVKVAQHCPAQVQFLYQTGNAGHLDDIAGIELVLQEDEQAVENVLDDALCAEADGDTDDAGGGNQRGDIVAKFGQDHEGGHGEGEHAGDADKDAGQRSGSLEALFLGVGAVVLPVLDVTHQAATQHSS